MTYPVFSIEDTHPIHPIRIPFWPFEREIWLARREESCVPFPSISPHRQSERAQNPIWKAAPFVGDVAEDSVYFLFRFSIFPVGVLYQRSTSEDGT